MDGPPILLSVHLPQDEPTERLFEKGPVVVGRSQRADLQIRDALLSREHARLIQDPSGWRVEDMDSHNGSYLNGKRVQEPATLRPGDVLTLGGSQIAVRRIGAASSHEEMRGALFQSAATFLDRDLRPSEAANGEDLRRHIDRLRVVLDVNQALSQPIALDRLLELILDRIFTHLEPDEAAIYLLRPGGPAACAASRSLHAGDGRPFFSTRLLHEVAEKGMAACVPDVVVDDRFAGAASILDAGVRTVLAAPLFDDQGSLGMVVIGSSADGRRFGEGDLELLVSLAAVATLRIRNVALNEEAVERRRLADQMALARRIQEGLLPDRLPELEGWGLYALNRPSNVVSGDFYTAQLRGDPPELVLMIADVAGKGVTASLLTASLEALCADPLEAGLGPHEVFARVSTQLLLRTPPERYATAFLGVIDPLGGRLRFANAGHLPALVVSGAGGHRWLKSHGLPLGLMPAAAYEPGEDSLAPGDLLVLFTDGFTEAFNEADEEFGQDRLVEVCQENVQHPLEEIASRIEESVTAFTAGAPPSDDRTLILLRRLG
jgi:sigma-B regulation protein RsbU (phosphoserine phosphatase)